MNKGELSEGYAFLYLLLFNEVPFADSDLKKISDSVKINSLAENNYRTYIVINNDKTLSVFNRSNEIIDRFDLNEIIDEKSLSDFFLSIKNKTELNIDHEFIKKKLQINSVKGSSFVKSDFLISFSHGALTYNDLQGISVKSYVGGKSTILNASPSTNIIYKVDNFQGKIADINSINTKSKVLDRISLITKKGGSFNYSGYENAIFEDNLRKVDSLMPESLSRLLLNRYTKNDKNFKSLIIDPKDKIHFTSLLKASAFGMFPTKVWDGTHNAKGIICVLSKGDLVLFHFLKEDHLNKYLFDNAYFETASTSRHNFGELYQKDENLFFKLNCQLRLS